MIHYAVNRGLYSYGPGDNDKPRPDIADGEPQISRRPEDHHGQSQEGHQVLPAGQPRDHLEGHQVRLRARVQHARALAVRHGLLRRHRRRADQARRDQGHPGHRDARRLDDRLQAQGAERGARLAGAGDADLDAGARGVRQEVRRQDAVDLRPVRRLHRPVHVQERRLGQARRAPAGQEHRAGPQPQLGREDRLPPGLPGLDHDRGGQRRLPSPRRGASSTARASSRATAPRRRRSSSRRSRATRTRSRSSRAAATASSR